MRLDFSRRINKWLSDEEPGALFSHGVWRFWFPVVCGFALLNAGLTAIIFSDGGRLQSYMGTIFVAIGLLVAWLAVCGLHYSTVGNRSLARGVSALDSASLLFVVAHCCFLLYIYGHLHTLQAAELDYKLAAETYNKSAQDIQIGNQKIVEDLKQIEAEQTKRARIENDSIYQARKAAQAGAQIRARRGSGVDLKVSTAEVKLAAPPEPPKETAAAFLTRYDLWIRILNFGELALAVITLIYIRNWSAKVNAPAEKVSPGFEDFSIAAGARAAAPTPALKTTTRGDLVDDPRARQKTTQATPPGLEELNAVLRLIAFQHPPGHFKTALRPTGKPPEYVYIRWMQSNRGEEVTKHSTSAKLSIL